MRALPLVLSFAAFLGVMAAFPAGASARQLPQTMSVQVSSVREAQELGALSAKLGYHTNFVRAGCGWMAKLGIGSAGTGNPPVCP